MKLSYYSLQMSYDTEFKIHFMLAINAITLLMISIFYWDSSAASFILSATFGWSSAFVYFLSVRRKEFKNPNFPVEDNKE